VRHGRGPGVLDRPSEHRGHVRVTGAGVAQRAEAPVARRALRSCTPSRRSPRRWPGWTSCGPDGSAARRGSTARIGSRSTRWSARAGP